MMLYQRIDLATEETVGEPGPLPKELLGLADYGDHSLADLSWLHPSVGYKGIGYAPYDPPPPPPNTRLISPLALMQRLTPQERIAIRQSGKDDVEVGDYLDLLDKATQVDLDHPDTVNGVWFLVSKGLLGKERVAEILA